MAERAIVIGADEVRRLLAGEVVEMRRAVTMRGVDFIGPGGEDGPCRNDPGSWGFETADGTWHVLDQSVNRTPFQQAIRCPFGVAGERRWCKETWAIRADALRADVADIAYRAESEEPIWHALKRPLMSPSIAGELGAFCWRSSVHMPRWASRMSVDITAVKCERSADGQAWEWVLVAKRAAIEVLP